MKIRNAALIGAALFCAGAAYAVAQPSDSASSPPSPPPSSEDVCLQSNRLWGFDIVDDRTVKITDRTYKRYIVHMTGGCVNLKTAVITNIAFITRTALDCVRRGDRVSFRSPDLGRLSCFVTTVEADKPAAPKEGA